MTNLKSRIMRACEYELDDHGSEWAKGIANEHQRLRPLIEALAESPVAIERFIKASTVTFDGQEKTSEWKDEWECARSGLDKAIANLERVVGGEG